MVDGSILLTDLGWQETKVVGPPKWSRFCDSATRATWSAAPDRLLGICGPPRSLRRVHSCFWATLAARESGQKVFVTDGAEWIEKWLSGAYPDATHRCIRGCLFSTNWNHNGNWMKTGHLQPITGHDLKASSIATSLWVMAPNSIYSSKINLWREFCQQAVLFISRTRLYSYRTHWLPFVLLFITASTCVLLISPISMIWAVSRANCFLNTSNIFIAGLSTPSQKSKPLSFAKFAMRSPYPLSICRWETNKRCLGQEA